MEEFVLDFYDSPLNGNVIYSFEVKCKDRDVAYQIGLACIKQWRMDWYVDVKVRAKEA